MARRKKSKGSRKPVVESERIPGRVQRSYKASVRDSKPKGPRTVVPSWARPAAPPLAPLDVLCLDSGGRFSDARESLVRRLDEAVAEHKFRQRISNGVDLADIWLMLWRCGLVGLPFTGSDVAKGRRSSKMLPPSIRSTSQVESLLEALSSLGLLTQIHELRQAPWQRARMPHHVHYRNHVHYRIRLPSDDAVETADDTNPWGGLEDFGRQIESLRIQAMASAQAVEKLGAAIGGVTGAKPPRSVQPSYSVAGADIVAAGIVVGTVGEGDE